MWGIKINDTWMDVPSDGKITFELNFSGFQDDVIPGSFSFPCDMPATPVNDGLFRHARLIDTYSKVKALSGELYILGNFFDRCSVVRLENNKNTYRCSVVLNGIKIDIKGKTLKDIELLSKYEQTFTDIDDLLSWMNSCNLEEPGETIFTWPVLKNTAAFDDIKDRSMIKYYFNGTLNPWSAPLTFGWYTDPDYPDSYTLLPRVFTTPKLRIFRIVEAIFSQFGYRVTGSFIEDPELRDATIYSNKILRADWGHLTSISAEYQYFTYSGNPYGLYHFPVLKLKTDPMDQDYFNLLDNYIDSPGGLQYPDSLPKVKVYHGRTYNVYIRAKVITSAMVDGFNMGFFGVGLTLLPGSPGTIDGSVAFQNLQNFVTTEGEIIANFIGWIDLTHPAYAPEHFEEVAIFPVIQENADISIEWLTLEIQETSYTGDDFIEPIRASEFCPARSIEDFLKALTIGLNLNFTYDWATNTVYIDRNVTSLQATAEPIDNRIGDLLPAKTLENTGFEFSWDWGAAEDKLTEENFKAFPEADFIGYFNNSPDDFAPPVDPPPNKYLLNLADNKIYKTVKPDSGQMLYEYFTDAFYPVKIGDGAKKITPPGMSPMLMGKVQLSSFLQCPMIEKAMHAPRFDQQNDDFSAIRISFYRGMLTKYGGVGLPVKAPTATTMAQRYRPIGESAQIGIYSLCYDTFNPDSLYVRMWRSWISFLMNTERIRDVIKLDLPFIQRVFRSQKKLKNSVFLAGKLTFTISSTGIEAGEIEMYRNNFNFDGATE